MSHRWIRRTLAASVALACIPAGADAAVRDVSVGAPPAAAKKLHKQQADAIAFFPAKSTVAAGDSVRFVPVGFHNVHLLAAGGEAVPTLAPTGSTASAKDAAGADFWFNGMPTFSLNPALFKMSWGKTFRFDGSKDVQSGMPLGDKLKPVTVKFTKPGSYAFLCEIHPGMKGTVTVVGKRRKARSAKAHAQAVAKQVKAALEAAKSIADVALDDATVQVGASGPGGLEYFGFIPAAKTVAPGTTLTFTMPDKSFEIHTAATGPGDPEKGEGYIGALAKSFESPVIDPVAMYPSDAPTSVASLTSSTHGNGFWNSGVIDSFGASPPGKSASVKFDQVGTYAFYCLVHPFMKGTVTVK